MKDLTVILPIHKYSEEISKLTSNAVKSYYEADSKHETNLIVIGPHNVLSEIRKSVEFNSKTNFIENEESDFATQINKAVDECTTTYFSILELDDIYTSHCFENFEKYASRHPEYMGLIPLNEVVDFQNINDGPIGYTNEAFWASSFSEKIGFPDEESLLEYLSINVTGAAFKKEDFIEIGRLKPSIKISFWHEFLLRALHRDKILFVIPKVGYIHYVNRTDSLADECNKNITQKEAEWWINLAQEEYTYKNDRKKKYEE